MWRPKLSQSHHLPAVEDADDSSKEHFQIRKSDPKADAVEQVLRISNSRLYQILGLDDRATKSEINQAFKKLSRLVHPDRNKHPKAVEAARSKVTHHVLIAYAND